MNMTTTTANPVHARHLKHAQTLADELRYAVDSGNAPYRLKLAQTYAALQQTAEDGGLVIPEWRELAS